MVTLFPFFKNVKDVLRERVNRPFPYFSPVSKHEEMRSRLGWTISYKSLYFVHPSLDLMPLFTGMRERFIDGVRHSHFSGGPGKSGKSGQKEDRTRVFLSF